MQLVEPIEAVEQVIASEVGPHFAPKRLEQRRDQQLEQLVFFQSLEVRPRAAAREIFVQLFEQARLVGFEDFLKTRFLKKWGRRRDSFSKAWIVWGPTTLVFWGGTGDIGTKLF